MADNNDENKLRARIQFRSEEERLREDMERPDMEKFRMFTRMLRLNALFKKAKITHKQ